MKRVTNILALTGLVALLTVSSAHASTFYVWMDSTLDGFKDTLLGSIEGYEGSLSGKKNYDYYSFSGHPIKGPNPHKNKLKLFVYEKLGTQKDFLNIIAGKDAEGPNRWRTFSMDFDITGSNGNPKDVLGDEPHQFSEVSEDHFEGDWRFKKNTDGGVIGGLKGDWEAKITFNDSELKHHLFASKGSENIHIDEYLDQGYNTYFISPYDELERSVVPEPATLLLFSSGMAGMFFRRRKRS